MKNRFVWVGAVALAVMVNSQTEAKAAFTNINGIVVSNGVVFITTRSASDAWFRTQSSGTANPWDGEDVRGPGFFSPGDVKMCEVLMDNGYTTHVFPEKALSLQNVNLTGPTLYWDGFTSTDPNSYYGGGGGFSGGVGNALYSPALIIVSGSGGSADMPLVNTNNIPIIMGEHSCLGDNRANASNERSEIYLYSNKSGNSGNNTSTNAANLYMKVFNPSHPIMQGIPLDALGRVKMYRDPYPEENAHGPRAEGLTSAKQNYETAWTTVNTAATKAVPAAGLVILGRLDTDTNQVVFAVMDAGGALASTVVDAGHPWLGRTTAPSRLVHFFVNEGGNGNSRRAFNCLSDIGKVIFLRTCKWAMGEALTPYVPLGLIKTTMVTPSKIQLEWTGSVAKNYKVIGTANLFGPSDFSNWQTIVEDIPGVDPGVGTTSVKLDISNGPQYAFLRVVTVP